MSGAAFPDTDALERCLAAIEADPVARVAMGRYEADFGVFHCAFTLLRDEG